MSRLRNLAVLELEPAQLLQLLDGQLVPEHNRWAMQALQAQMADFTRGRGAAWWGGLRNGDEARALLRGGWKAGGERALKLAAELRGRDLPMPQTRRRVGHWGEAGDDVCLDRLRGGNVDAAWRDTVRPVRTGVPNLNVVVPWGVPGSWGENEAFWSGAAALAVTDLLEEIGFSVGLLAASPSLQDAGALLACCRVKEPGEPLRADVVAALVCHLGVSRLTDFAAVLHAPFPCRSDLGSAGEIPEAWAAAVADRLVEPAAIVFRRLASREQAVKAVRQVLQAVRDADEQGVMVGDEAPVVVRGSRGQVR